MTQQVIKTRTVLAGLATADHTCSFDTYWEQLGTDTNVNLSTVNSKLTTFMNTTSSGMTHPMGAYIGNTISRGTNACSFEYYDITNHLDGSPAGSPIQVDTWTLHASADPSGPLPEGVCAMIGYRSDYGTDVEFAPGARPRARDRNRIYFGPLISDAVANADGTSKQCLMATDFVSNLTIAFPLLISNSGSSDVTGMVQWSRENAAVKHILVSWLDITPRYQRRRDPSTGLVYTL